MADVEATPAPDAAGATKKKLMMVGAVAFLVGSGAGIGGAMMMGGSEAPAEGEETADLPPDGDPNAPVVVKDTREVVPFEDFTINLRGTGGGRVLRLEVAAEIDQADTEVVQARMPALRDAVVTLASDYTYNDLEGLDGKMRLRDELLARLNTSLEEEAKVKRVYFTNFTVQ